MFFLESTFFKCVFFSQLQCCGLQKMMDQRTRLWEKLYVSSFQTLCGTEWLVDEVIDYTVVHVSSKNLYVCFSYIFVALLFCIITFIVFTQELVLYSQYLRVRRNCSNDDTFRIEANKLGRDYYYGAILMPHLKRSFKKAFMQSRNELLHFEKVKKKQVKIILTPLESLQNTTINKSGIL